MRSRGTCWLAPPQGRPDVRCGKLPDARAMLGGKPEDQAAKQEKLQGLSSQAKRSDSALRIATLNLSSRAKHRDWLHQSQCAVEGPAGSCCRAIGRTYATAEVS